MCELSKWGFFFSHWWVAAPLLGTSCPVVLPVPPLAPADHVENLAGEYYITPQMIVFREDNARDMDDELITLIAWKWADVIAALV